MSTKDLSKANRKKLAARGQALQDGSYPVADTEDLKNAIASFGRAVGAGKAVAVKSHIIKRAKALNATNLLPADWPGSTKDSSDAGNKDEVAASVLAEYEPATEADPEILAELLELSESESEEEPEQRPVVLSAVYEEFVPLARIKQGQLFRKQILQKNVPFSHPQDPKMKITIDDRIATSLVDNFNAGVCDIVQVPLCGSDNSHSEAPDRNIGEVIGLEQDSKGVYAVMDVRDPAHAAKVGKTYLGASGMLHMNYTDTRTGKKVGPALLHVAVTNRPHVVGLENFSEVIAASADPQDQPVLLTPMSLKGDTMELAELKKLLKEEHNIDLDALQASSSGSSGEEVSEAVLSALSTAGVLQLSQEETVTEEDILGAIKELAEEKVSLSGRVEGLEKEGEALKLSAATIEVEGLVRTGRILPTQKDAMLELSMSNRKMFESLIPAQAVVTLSEFGVVVHEEPDEDIDKEITRLSNMANASTGKPAKS